MWGVGSGDHGGAELQYASVTHAIEEFLAAVEEEFGVEIDADSRLLQTPGDVIDFLVESTSPADGMDDDEHREHIASVLGELLAQTLGVTRYTEATRFQDMKPR